MRDIDDLVRLIEGDKKENKKKKKKKNKKKNKRQVSVNQM